MEETRIARNDFQLNGPGLLEMVMAGDARAADELRALIQEDFISKSQLPMIFTVAAKNADTRKREVEGIAAIMNPENMDEVSRIIRPIERVRSGLHKLACLAAWKMKKLQPEYILSLHETFMYAVQNPDKVNLEQLHDLGIGEMVLIGQGIVHNGKIIQIAEALTEGLANTSDGSKIKELLRIGEAVRSRMPDDIAKVYEYVFECAKMPEGSESRTMNLFLASLHRREREKINPNETVVKRLESILNKDAKPEHAQVDLVLSDGDANLPTSHIGQKEKAQRRTLLQRAKEILPFVAKKARNGLVFARR